MERQQHIILFDGICNLCTGVVRFIIRHDKKALFSFASLQSEKGQSLLKSYYLPTENFDSFVYIENGKIYRRSSAVLHLVKKLDGLWPILSILMVIPKPIRDFFYKLVANNRYRLLGKKDSCMVPTPELRQRFL